MTAEVLVLDKHEESGWNELPEWVREAVEILGYTEQLWYDDMEPATYTIQWKELTLPQQEAATKLGYTEVLWDVEIPHIGTHRPVHGPL